MYIFSKRQRNFYGFTVITTTAAKGLNTVYSSLWKPFKYQQGRSETLNVLFQGKRTKLNAISLKINYSKYRCHT